MTGQQGRRQIENGWTEGASRTRGEREPIMEVGVQGLSPWSGVQGAKPP